MADVLDATQGLEGGKEVQTDDGKREHVAREANVACALAVLACGPVFDALCALPGVAFDDLPASLRASSLVLAAMLGSPPIRKAGLFVLEPRIVLAVLLACCAFIGLNAAEVKGRNADAVFSFVGTLACAAAVTTNGVNEQTDNTQRKKMSREQMSAFCGALLFYLGARTTRHGFALPSEVLNFKVSHGDISTPGYAVASDLVVVGNVFAGSVAASFGLILLLNHHLVLHVGSAAMSTVAGVLACFVFLGTLFAQLASYAVMEKLPALFSEFACDGTTQECAAAFRARRFLLGSQSTSVNWVCAVAMATFAFSNRRQFRTRSELYEYVAPLATLESVAVLAASLLAVLLIVLFADPIHPMLLAETELVLLVVSIPAALFGWPTAACAFHAIGQVLYIYNRMQGTGYKMTYYTHWSLAATLFLTAAIGVTTLLTYLLYNVGQKRLVSDPIEFITAVLLTALVSVQTFLTLGTLGMASGYSGCFYASSSEGWRSTGYSYMVQHSVSFFFAAALYASRYEHFMLGWRTRIASYSILPAILGIAWLIAIFVSPEQHGADPYTNFVDVASFVIGVSAAAVAWAGVGLCLVR